MSISNFLVSHVAAAGQNILGCETICHFVYTASTILVVTGHTMRDGPAPTPAEEECWERCFCFFFGVEGPASEF